MLGRLRRLRGGQCRLHLSKFTRRLRGTRGLGLKLLELPGELVVLRPEILVGRRERIAPLLRVSQLGRKFSDFVARRGLRLLGRGERGRKLRDLA